MSVAYIGICVVVKVIFYYAHVSILCLLHIGMCVVVKVVVIIVMISAIILFDHCCLNPCSCNNNPITQSKFMLATVGD